MSEESKIAIDLLMEQSVALYAFAYSRLKDHHLAEDLVQDTIISAWKSWGSFQGTSPVLTWLTGILRHKILDHFRSSSRRPTISLDEPEENHHTMSEIFDDEGNWKIDPNHGMQAMMQSPAKAAQNKDLRIFIAQCLDKLPDRMRHLFLSREIDHCSVAESAKMAGLTEGSAGVLLTRARHLLRLCLQQSLKP